MKRKQTMSGQLQSTLDRVSRFKLWMMRNRRVHVKPTETVKINLGSGLFVAPGWINVEGRPIVMFAVLPTSILGRFHRQLGYSATEWQQQFMPVLKHNRFVHHELAYGLPFPDDCADYVFSSHALEHMEHEDARHVIEEIHRVLKKGGVARIAVPDLNYARHLLDCGDKQDALALLYGGYTRGAYAAHRFIYDYDLLKEMFEQAGFSSVRHCTFRCGAVPDLDILDNREEETVFVEATK
jgi:predicted SAM-dependent methyltransferase